METQPFFIEFFYNDKPQIAEVKPCCQEDNAFYYDIYFDNNFEFTIAPNNSSSDIYNWRLALANADKKVDPGLVETIGQQIQTHLVSNPF